MCSPENDLRRSTNITSHSWFVLLKWWEADCWASWFICSWNNHRNGPPTNCQFHIYLSYTNIISLFGSIKGWWIHCVDDYTFCFLLIFENVAQALVFFFVCSLATFAMDVSSVNILWLSHVITGYRITRLGVTLFSTYRKKPCTTKWWQC